MAFDNSKYDLELNSVGLRVENYRKSETVPFIPRLGAGNQSESEFDLLKSRTLEDFSGGILQREWIDDHSIFGSEQLAPIYDDGVLYPVKALSTDTSLMGKSTVTAKCQTKDYLFIAINNYNGTAFNQVKRIDTAGTVTSITIPTQVRDDPSSITTLVIWNNQLWGCSAAGTGEMFYMATSATTATRIAGGVGSLTLLIVWNGQLYGSGGGTDTNAALFRYSGDTSTKALTEVGAVQSRYPDYNGALTLFNGRIILTRTDGMWAYDGIRLAPIDDVSSNVNERNFRYPCVLKGALYYFMYDGFYRYTGSLVEKLYDISEVGFPVDACVGKNRIWITYSNSAYSGSSRYDKAMGYDYSAGTSINGRVAIFDGKAMYTYARTANDGKPGLEDLARQGENSKIVWFADKVYVFTYYSKTNAGLYFYGSTAELTNTGTAAWKIITSIFDADFSMINKAIENIELVLDGDATSDETITIEYKTTGFSDSTGWTTLGTIKTQSKLQEYVFRSIPAGLLFKKIQFRFSATTTLGYGFRKIIFRYLLVPDLKWQWNFNVNAFGDNPVEPLMLKDGTQSTQPVATLRGTIYAARDNGIPLGFTDIDQLDLNGSHNSAVTTITLNSTALLKKSGFVKIDDEIIKYSAKTDTTLTGCERAMFSTTAATHSDNAKVFPYYRVLVRNIPMERIEMDDSDLDRTEDKAKPSQITVVLQEV
jgi:hypothetical protein